MATDNSNDDAQLVRLYIGAISKDLYDEQELLTSRLLKFGELVSVLEVHQKPTSLTYFAYIDMKITPKNLVKLKQHLNGVKFKNSKLIIDKLSKTYQEKWEEDRLKPDTKEEDRLKRDKIALRRLERILHGKDELVIKGRIRKTPRKNLKNLTLRCYMNGKLIAFKNNKTKVWGYDKTKKLRDLTWIFEKGTWKDGNLHIVEKFNSNQSHNKEDFVTMENIEDDDDEEEVFEVEKNTNKKILSSLFENFDFNEPINLDELEKEEESGESDYEFELKFNRDNYDIKTKDCTDGSKIIEEYKKSHPVPDQQVKPIEEDDEYEEVDDVLVPIRTDDARVPVADVARGDENEKPARIEESDVDDEFIPTFGKKNESDETNATEKLRDLFNPVSTSTFKLQEGSDIDEIVSDDEMNIEKEEIQLQQLSKRQELNIVTNKSLFFIHDDSPFLLSQSQLSKISRDFNKTEYETWFYEKRGELNREFKRYKRDYVRQLNKKK